MGTLADHEIAFPMAGNLAVGYLGGAFVDAHHVGDSVATIVAAAFQPTMILALPHPREEGALQLTLREKVEPGVDRLVGDAHRQIIRVIDAPPRSDLLRRPAHRHAFADAGEERRPVCELPQLRPPAMHPRTVRRLHGTVLRHSATSSDLTAHR